MTMNYGSPPPLFGGNSDSVQIGTVKEDASGNAFVWDGERYVPFGNYPDYRPLLMGAGYSWVSGEGPNAVWRTPSGNVISESVAVQAANAAATRAPAAPPAPRYPTAGIAGNLTYVADPYTGQVTFGQQVPGTLTEEQQRANTLADLAAQRQFTTGERIGSQEFTAGENALNRALTAGQFAAGLEQQRIQNQFQAEQDYQNRLRQYAQDRLAAAQAFASQVSAVDPAALEAFYAAGGGNISNALAGGANALSENVLLPAARTLRTTREMATPTRYGGFDQPFQLPQTMVQQAPARSPFVAPQVTTSQVPPTTGGFSAYDPNNLMADWIRGLAPPQQQAPSVSPAGASSGAPALSTPEPRFPALANEDVGNAPRFPTLANEDVVPRYAFGTMGEPAKGEFITGDSTHPTDPFAGGAKPEKVTLKDPPGPNNAEAEVEPMSPPEHMGENPIAALFHAIADMIEGGNIGQDSERYAYGTMKRYAYGTGYESIRATPEDQPYLGEVRNLRQNVQYPQLNPYSTKFGFTPPSLVDRFYAGRQTQFGIPVADQLAEQQRYQLRGTSRGAFSLGI